MKNPFLVGQKIYLRPHEDADLPVWTSWFNDPEVTATLEQAYYPNTVVLQKGRLEALYGNSSIIQLAIVDRATDELVGTVSLHSINLFNRNGEVSIVVGNRKYWGKGLGREAVSLIVRHGFEKLDLHKITANMVVSNEGSRKVFEAAGFHLEATVREQVYVQGKFQDVYKMAIFKDGRSRTRT